MKKLHPINSIPSEQVISGTVQLGALIRLARKEAGIPIDQAALLAGVSKQFLSDLENGKPTIQLGKAIDVAAKFGIELFVRRRGLSALHAASENDK